ncbi:hypothetical protein EUGRSUZ_G01252 [Eucalyptus grandis]|uniref:Uncharacterized protein n=2 Tax=Eucalyptus grandis TaxID=71139 RepID=A0ACC3K3F8_EUCGR|nr:hypothetical protein EUGRSUZ_G01252 [Eucalyptus grandis]
MDSAACMLEVPEGHGNCLQTGVQELPCGKEHGVSKGAHGKISVSRFLYFSVPWNRNRNCFSFSPIWASFFIHHTGFFYLGVPSPQPSTKNPSAVDSNSVRPRRRLRLRPLAGDIVAHLAVDSDFVLPAVDDSAGSDRVEPISGSSPRSEPAALPVNLRTRASFSDAG